MLHMSKVNKHNLIGVLPSIENFYFRQMLLCRVCLGRSFLQFNASKLAHAPPGHHSVIGRPSQGGLVYPEYVIYRGEQASPEYSITYNLLIPVNSDRE